MNIENLFTVDRHEAGAEMQVKDENGKLLDLFITLVGVDSKAWRIAEIEMKRQLLAGFDPVEATADAMGKCTIGWRGFQSEGDDLEFSRESVTNLYLSAPYIGKQADKFLSDRANFMKGKVEN